VAAALSGRISDYGRTWQRLLLTVAAVPARRASQLVSQYLSGHLGWLVGSGDPATRIRFSRLFGQPAVLTGPTERFKAARLPWLRRRPTGLAVSFGTIAVASPASRPNHRGRSAGRPTGLVVSVGTFGTDSPASRSSKAGQTGRRDRRKFRARRTGQPDRSTGLAVSVGTFGTDSRASQLSQARQPGQLDTIIYRGRRPSTTFHRGRPALAAEDCRPTRLAVSFGTVGTSSRESQAVQRG
jgi:hypothetical protein